MSEYAEQVALLDWCLHRLGVMPELEFLFAVPNGELRDKVVAVKLKRAGVKAGVPDLFWPLPCGGYHGLWIENKWGRNTLSDDQTRWVAFLRGHGYLVLVSYDWRAAGAAIENYYGLPPALRTDWNAIGDLK